MTDKDKEAPPMFDQFTVHGADANYKYRWCNTRDRAMLAKRNVGWEVDRTAPDDLPPEIARQGQATENVGGGTTRMRGDLILMRIPKAVHEERVEKPRRAAAERQGVSLDTMVQQADENAKRSLKAKGYKPESIRSRHVFLEERADSK